MVLANAVWITPAAIIAQGHYTTRNCSLTGASTRSTGVIFGVHSLITLHIQCVDSRSQQPADSEYPTLCLGDGPKHAQTTTS